MRLAVALVAALAVMLSPSVTEACSCVGERTIVSPGDGVIDVPLNPRIIVKYQYDEALVELRAVATQEVVPLTFEAHSDRGNGTWKMAAAVALEPNTQYEMTLTTSALPPTRTTFTTGSSTDLTPSAFGGLESIALETMKYPIIEADGSQCHSSCVERQGTDHVSRIRLGYADPPADVALLVFELIRESDRTVVGEVVILPRTSSSDERVLGFETCDRRAPPLAVGDLYCGRLIAYDIAGNTTGQSVEVCDTAASCRPQLGAQQCTPADDCVPETTSSDSSGCSATGAPSVVAGLAGLAALCGRRRRRPS